MWVIDVVLFEQIDIKFYDELVHLFQILPIEKIITLIEALLPTFDFAHTAWYTIQSLDRTGITIQPINGTVWQSWQPEFRLVTTLLQTLANAGFAALLDER